MIAAGLTGNIGSGKSTVAQVFAALGVPVFHADRCGREALNREEVIQKITDRFGNAILSEGRINRKQLAGIVFSDADRLTWLNSLIHPVVKESFQHWVTKQNSLYVLLEAAILFESGFHTMMHTTVFVDCPEEIAIERVMKRDGADREEILQRASFQWEREKKAEMADYIILNNGQHALIPQALSIHEDLRRHAKREAATAS